jgi:hypothetical protein
MWDAAGMNAHDHSVEVIAVTLEVTPKKVFASALDWPGWSRGGKDEAGAIAALEACRARYGKVAALAGHPLPSAVEYRVVERQEGNANTTFGVPALPATHDVAAVTSADAARLADLLAAAWRVFDEIVAVSQPILTKGPRGGGRDRDVVVEHVWNGEDAYRPKIGLLRRRSAGETVAQHRPTVQAAFRGAASGYEGRWPIRYAARRFVWHVLDHAWEIEDRQPAL